MMDIVRSARHASAFYDFGITYASRKYARWLLDTHNNQHGFLERSENALHLKEPLK